MARKKAAAQAAGPKASAEQLNDDDMQALFFQHKTAIGNALAAKKLADARFKNACKLAKAELGKNAVADIKLATELEEEDGDAILKDRIERSLRVARWMGSNVGTQFEMFDGEDRTPSIDRARAAGKRAGLAGEPKKPPHDPSTEQYREWMTGFDEGQEVLVRRLGPKDGTDDAERPVGVPREEWKRRMRELGDMKLGDQPSSLEVVQ